MKKYKNYIIILLIILTCCITICFIPIGASRFIPAIEAQVSKDFGVQIHIERLILRLGPSLKVKAPVMHIMYEDGQKFGQFTNVRFVIPWSSLLKNDTVVKRLYADKFIMKTSDNDKSLNTIIDKLSSRNFKEIPDIALKAYSISYLDNQINKKYTLSGSNLEIAKIVNYENLKLKTIGNFSIDDKKYLSYDLVVVPNVKPKEFSKDFNIRNLAEQIEAFDFHSDIMADLKLYNNINGDLQISGFVNVDGITVLENQSTKKNQKKSFIYLTFLGDKTGILSNIYASDDKKVYIDGMINNSKKHSLDIKVKTDEIELADLYKKIKLLADLSRYKSIESVTGHLLADFSIKGDINKIKSTGYLKIKDASIKANGVDINKISSDIDFSNNMINIANAIGYVNNAPLMLKGKIDKAIDLELLMSKVELKYLLPKELGVKSGIASLAANISGTLGNIVHKENLQIDNFICINKNNSVSFNSFKIDTNKDNIAYVNNIIINTDKFESIKLPLLKLYVERDSIKIPETNIFMPNSKLSAKADIMNYGTSALTFNTNVSGFINSRDIKSVKANYAPYTLKLSVNGNKNVQNILAQVLMEKALILDEPSILNFSSKIENNNLKIEDLSIASFAGKLQNDFKLNLRGNKKIIISGSVENLDAPIFRNVRIFIPQQLNVTLMDTLAQLKGDIFVNGNIQKPEVVGQITAQNIINQFLQLTINNLTIDFNKNNAVFNAPQVKIADSVMGVSGTSDLYKDFRIKNMVIKSKYVNTDTFLMYKDNPVFASIPLTIDDGKFYAERVLASVYNSPLTLTAFSTDFSLKNSNLAMKNITAEMFNGKIAGNIDFNLKEELFNTRLQARGVSAAPIFDLISTRKDSVSGVMDFDTTVCGNLTSKQSLNGAIKFIVNNGRMGTLGKLEHLLYAQNVVADNMLRTSLSVVTKAITLKDTGLFKFLRGDITLKDGIANINFLQSQGPLMSLFIKGTYNPDTDYAKLTVLGRLSDEVISGLGVFGDFSFNKLMIMLTGEDTKFNILPEDFEKLPQLPMKNTKEFRSVINGVLDKPSSVLLFNWISYSQKSYKQKDVPTSSVKVPEFVESLPY